MQQRETSSARLEMTVGYSVLFCDCARSEGRAANAPTGVMADKGFSADQLRAIAANLGPYKTRVVELNNFLPAELVNDAVDPCVLVLQHNQELADDALKEVTALKYDTFTASRGKVVNAHSRHMVFLGSHGSRAPDPATGLNTVKDFSEVPALERARAYVTELLGTTDCNSGCVIKYPDIDKCGIGWHGDGERRQTIVMRVGGSTYQRPLCFQWYLRGEPVGKVCSITLRHGDMAIACAKAVGTDWKTRNVLTLRHATGFLKQGPVPAPTSKTAKTALKRKRVYDEEFEGMGWFSGSTGGAGHLHGGPGL